MLPITEQANERTANISSQSALEIVALMNDEDALVAPAVKLVLPEIAATVDKITDRILAGGRLFYVGTGTSGRLGVLDASECPPTFGVSLDLIQGVIAGGYEALHSAVEASEDDADAGKSDLAGRGVTGHDSVIGLAASGRTPYTIGALKHARSLGAFTAAITCAPGSAITSAAEISIVPVVGPEVITGSTRLKSGTAQKMVLNMLSTATLIRLGYVSGNRMTNVKARNSKLNERALRILIGETGLPDSEARFLFEAAGNALPVAITMYKAGADRLEAELALKKVDDRIELAVAALNRR